MTLEYSLRGRARGAKFRSVLWLLLAVGILVLGWCLLKAMLVMVDAHSNNESLAAIMVGAFFCSMLLGCYLLGRYAQQESELSIRLNALADALCLSKGDPSRFEKLAAIMVPRTHSFSSSVLPTSKDLQPIADLLKELK